MSYSEPLSQITIGISISGSQDMDAIGLAEEHLRDAMTEVARHLLAMGARLVYGGDLRTHGFTELLIELVTRYRRDADIGDNRAAIVHYLAWPVLRSMDSKKIQEYADSVAGLAELHYLDTKGRDFEIEQLKLTPSQPTSEEWSSGLTAMRRTIAKLCDAQIILGGKISNFNGLMPGIAEEAIYCMNEGKPLFIVGGFGGCSRIIAEELGLVPKREMHGDLWEGHSIFSELPIKVLNNGLNCHENQTLARTAHIDEAITLILRGLFRRFSDPGL